MTSSFWTFSFATWFITEKHREYVYALRLLLCDGLHWFADIYGFCLWLRVLLLAVPLHRKLLSQPLLREANRTSSDWRVGLTAVAPVNWASVAKLYPAVILYQNPRCQRCHVDIFRLDKLRCPKHAKTGTAHKRLVTKFDQPL